MATPLLDAEIAGIMIAASQEAEKLEDQILLQASQLYEVEKQAITEKEEDTILLKASQQYEVCQDEGPSRCNYR